MTDLTEITKAYELHRKAVAQANALNKQSLFDALASAGITLVCVVFDGESDQGQVEDAQAYANDTPVQLPSETVERTAVSLNTHELDSSSMPIAEAVATLCYDYLEQEHGGWENNDGGFGEFKFRVPDRVIELHFNARFTESLHFHHSF